MRTDNLPRTDLGLKAFLENLSNLISLTPTAYGVDAGIATELAAKVGVFDAALAAAIEPSTRGPAKTLAKNLARADVKAYAREVIKQVQGTITVTDEQRQALGITIPKPREPIPVPDSSPVLEVKSVVGRIVKIRVHSAAGESSRAKPDGVAYASIYSFVGDEAPADPTLYKFEGVTTRADATLAFPITVPSGATVWLSASWSNPRGQAGVGCTPVSFTLQGGPAVAVA